MTKGEVDSWTGEGRHVSVERDCFGTCLAAARAVLAAAAILLGTVVTGPAWADAAHDCAVLTGEFAIEACTKAIRADPREATFYFNRGVEWAAKGQLDKAIADYDRAVDLRPGYLNAIYNRAVAWQQKGYPAVAMTDLRRALAIDPNDADTLRALRQIEGRDLATTSPVQGLPRTCYIATGAAGVAACSREIAQSPDNSRLYWSRGIELAKLARHDEALADFTKAIELDPGFASAFAYRGTVWEAKGDKARAAADFAKALSLDPTDATAKGRAPPAAVASAGPNAETRPSAPPSSGGTGPAQPPSPKPAGSSATPFEEIYSDFFASRPSAKPAPPATPVASTPAAAPLASERRVALVVGNAAYAAAGRLANPVNDARDMTEALRGLGFDVTLAEDLDRTAFEQSIGAFAERAEGADVVLFFYSGHGMGVGGETFLLPVDAQFRTEYEAQRRTIGLTDLLAQLKGRAGIVMAFIDACRNNPLAEQLAAATRAQGRAATVSRGLAPIQVSGSETLLVYATTPGRTADDGKGRNSPFTAALLEHLGTPALDVETMLKRVSDKVKKATANQQEPERLSRLAREFYFRPGVPASDSSAPAGPAARPGAGDAEARADFLLAKEAASVAVWTSFLARHPDGFYADLARVEREKLSRGASAQPVLPAAAGPGPYGFQLADLTDEARARYGIERSVKGVLIAQVDPGSPAAAKKLEPGEVIVEVQQSKVDRPDSVISRLEALKRDDRRLGLLLVMNPQGSSRFVALPLQ